MKPLINKFWLFILLIQGFTVLAQAPAGPVCAGTTSNSAGLPCSYTPYWDWTDPTYSNWQAQLLSGAITMGSPFYSNTNTNDMIKIVDGQDFLPAQGWVLLSKDFGCIGQQAVNNATPYFILYNKYKSIVRVFLYLGNSSYGNRASINLKWSPANGGNANNSLFTFGNKYPLASENYPIFNNPDKNLNYLNQLGSSGGWVTTEYLVHFDPNTPINPGNFQYINFDYIVSNSSAISLSGDFTFSTESATAKDPGTPVASSTSSNALDYVVTGKNALAKMPKESDFTSGFNGAGSVLTSLNKVIPAKLADKMNLLDTSLQNGRLKKYLLGLAKLTTGSGEVLGALGTVLEVFMTKSNSAVANNTETFIQPTISKGSMALTGTIVTVSNPLSISLQLPGTSHKYANNTINCPNLPVYDCPLGLVGLKEAPAIEVRTYTVPERVGYFNSSVDFQIYAASCAPPPIQYNQTVVGNSNQIDIYRRTAYCNVQTGVKTLKSYKVVGDVKLALNEAVGAQIESAKAALYFDIKDNAGTPYFSLTQTNSPNPAPCVDPLTLLPTNCPYVWTSNSMQNALVTSTSNVYTETVPYKNYAKDLLENGALSIASWDDANGYHKFQTPFINLEEFKNTAITLEEGVNVYLKILVTLKPTNLNDDPTPVVFLATYSLTPNKFIAVAGNNSFVMTCAQKNEMAPVVLGQSNTITNYPTQYISGVNITMANNSTVTAFTTPGQTEFVAYSKITLKDNFRAVPQSTYSSFIARLDLNAGGCATSANARVIQGYFANCAVGQPASAHRIAHWAEDSVKKVLAEIDDKMHDMAAGISDRLSMSIVPNPNNGNFTLRFTQKVEAGSVKVLNALGESIYNKVFVNDSEQYELNLNGILTNGAYYITWNNSTFVIKQKLIVN